MFFHSKKNSKDNHNPSKIQVIELKTSETYTLLGCRSTLIVSNVAQITTKNWKNMEEILELFHDRIWE
jgi:hypothetical protein